MKTEAETDDVATSQGMPTSRGWRRQRTRPQRLQRVAGPGHTLTLDLWLPGPGGMSFRGLLSLLRRLQGTRRLHMGDGGARARGSPATCAGGRGSHHLCPREARTGRHSVSVRAKTWSPVWHLGPQRRRPPSPSLRQKPHLPAVGGWGRPGSPQHASIHKSVFPKARARRLCIRDDFMWAWVGIFHFNGRVFIFMVTFYLRPWGWLLAHRRWRVPFRPDREARGGVVVEAVSSRGACLWSAYCALGPANRLNQAAGGRWARG